MRIMLAHYYRMDVDTVMSRLVFDKCIRDTTFTVSLLRLVVVVEDVMRKIYSQEK